MDYEKLHKDTITKLQEMVNSGKITVETACGICADFAPESEDERIRKLLIEAVIQVLQDQYCSNRGVSKEKVVAWLEKQGKNNMGISEATKKKLEDNLQKALEKETPKSCNEFLEKQCEQKPVINMKTPEESLGVDSDTYNKIVDECIYGEQNTAWSEEDEKMLNDILMCGEHHCYLDAGNITWLKSIKDKVQPQQKQEWSEEDSPYYDDICEILINLLRSETANVNKTAVQKDLDWLNSLKDRVQLQQKQEWSEEDYNEIETIACHLDNTDNEGLAEVLRNIRDKYYHIVPQSTWKPSDEQIIELRHVISGCSYDIEPLVELETKLKEL